MANFKDEVDESALDKKTIVVKRITSATKNGDTSFYITDDANQKYIASIKVSDELPFISIGDKMSVDCYNANGYLIITKIN